MLWRWLNRVDPLPSPRAPTQSHRRP
jgi:hypothetical protein